MASRRTAESDVMHWPERVLERERETLLKDTKLAEKGRTRDRVVTEREREKASE